MFSNKAAASEMPSRTFSYVEALSDATTMLLGIFTSYEIARATLHCGGRSPVFGA